MDSREPEKAPGEVPGEARRRSYAPPRILYREPLEAMAAICSPPGKGNPGFCPQGPISS
jgi:hypothetical protein